MRFTVKERGSGAVIASADENAGVTYFEGNWYYAPEHVNMAHLRVTERVYTCPYKGRCYWIDLDSPNEKVQNVGWTYFDVKSGYEWIQGQIAFYSRDTAGTLAARDTAVTA
jgi:uncharacterized protein (DUF427 family)